MTYFLYSDGGASFRSKETIIIVVVRLSSIELRMKVTNPTWKLRQNL